MGRVLEEGVKQDCDGNTNELGMVKLDPTTSFLKVTLYLMEYSIKKCS